MDHDVAGPTGPTKSRITAWSSGEDADHVAAALIDTRDVAT
jgi:hypothetical protein